MPKGIAVNIGLNQVDPIHYQGWNGQLAACEFDATDMNKLAKSKGYDAHLFLTKDATAGAVIAAITGAAKQLKQGDIFFLSYSGHGGQVPDRNGDEEDNLDETWVLYDRQLVDDELYAMWSQFAAGVRIVVLSDSCHSGTAVRVAMYEELASSPQIMTRALMPMPTRPVFRALPEDVEKKTYLKNKDLYDTIQQKNPSGDNSTVNASILLISGCQDNQLSADGDRNGLFTQTLLKVWNAGHYRGNYRLFHRKIQQLMPPWQSPNLFLTGASDLRFPAQRPFTI